MFDFKPFALPFALLFSLLYRKAPDKERNIRCDRQECAYYTVLRLNQYVVNSVVNYRSRKKSEGANPKELALLNEGNADADKQGAHAVHTACAECTVKARFTKSRQPPDFKTMNTLQAA